MFFLLCCILLSNVYGNSASERIKTLVLAFGPYENTTLALADHGALNLNLFRYVLNKTMYAHPLNGTVKWEYKLIEDSCSFHFDWISNSYKILGINERNISDVSNLNTDYNCVIHIGPMCECASLDAINIETSEYIKTVQDSYKDSNETFHLFASTSFSSHLSESSVNHLSKFATSNWKSKFGSGQDVGVPYFVPLSPSIVDFSKLVFEFASLVLSNYTALLSPVRSRSTETGLLCTHFTKSIMKLSGEKSLYFMRFHYVGTQSESEWLEIWNQILQRSRYIIYCGDIELFGEWLEAGKKLFAPHKLSDFAIFYSTSGSDKTNDQLAQLFANDFSKFIGTHKESIVNIKLISIRFLVACNHSQTVGSFCANLTKDMSSVVNFSQVKHSKLLTTLRTRDVFFSALSVFNFFDRIFSKTEKLTKNLREMKSLKEVTQMEMNRIEVYDFVKSSKGLVAKERCTFTENGLDHDCKFHWATGEPMKAPGKCGYGECQVYLPADWKTVFSIILSITGVGIGMSIVCVCCYVRRKKQKEAAVTPLGSVQIKFEDVKPLKMKPKEFGDRTLRVKDAENSAKMKLSSTLEPILGVYIATTVLVVPFNVAESEVNDVLSEVTKLRQLSLENVAKIHGYICQTDPLMYGLVMESGDHGSLFLLLELDELDLIMKLPLLADLARGLEQIHKSTLKHHGQLTSHCCVVDNHFMLKIQLTEFASLLKLAPTDKRTPRIKKDADRIWQAPEILRNERKINMQLADVYSFAIIAHEIIYQKGPYFVPRKELSQWLVGKEKLPVSVSDVQVFIVKILRDKDRRQIRPTMRAHHGEETCMLLLKEMLKNCWDDSPSKRFHLTEVNKVIRKTMKELKIVSAFGNMVERLEFYSKHLQEAVQQKAEKVEEERRRVREVLDHLFPGGIAKMLIDSKRPPPNVYTNICVYVNDLVSFTTICAANEPATVVRFLNTLFVKYDNVIEHYKIHPVTRIGDAYMLVSGIPFEENPEEHASEIAQAALQIVEAVKMACFEDVKNVAGDKMQIRTGIASGGVVAGVVGKEIPSFCITGLAVTTAFKMESNSEAMKILVAQSTYELLKNTFELKFAKAVVVNDKSVNAYWLTGRKGSDNITMDRRLDGKPSIKDQLKGAAIQSTRNN